MTAVPTESQACDLACGHNNWDHVRTRAKVANLRCRTCEARTQLPTSDEFYRSRCLAFRTADCADGDACPLLHVHRGKQGLAERAEKHGQQILERVPQSQGGKAVSGRAEKKKRPADAAPATAGAAAASPVLSPAVSPPPSPPPPSVRPTPVVVVQHFAGIRTPPTFSPATAPLVSSPPLVVYLPTALTAADGSRKSSPTDERQRCLSPSTGSYDLSDEGSSGAADEPSCEDVLTQPDGSSSLALPRAGTDVDSCGRAGTDPESWMRSFTEDDLPNAFVHGGSWAPEGELVSISFRCFSA